MLLLLLLALSLHLGRLLLDASCCRIACRRRCRLALLAAGSSLLCLLRCQQPLLVRRGHLLLHGRCQLQRRLLQHRCLLRRERCKLSCAALVACSGRGRRQLQLRPQRLLLLQQHGGHRLLLRRCRPSGRPDLEQVLKAASGGRVSGAALRRCRPGGPLGQQRGKVEGLPRLLPGPLQGVGLRNSGAEPGGVGMQCTDHNPAASGQHMGSASAGARLGLGGLLPGQPCQLQGNDRPTRWRPVAPAAWVPAAAGSAPAAPSSLPARWRRSTAYAG